MTHQVDRLHDPPLLTQGVFKEATVDLVLRVGREPTKEYKPLTPMTKAHSTSNSISFLYARQGSLAHGASSRSAAWSTPPCSGCL